MSDRELASRIAWDLEAKKTSKIIQKNFCYDKIFSSAIEEIGVAKTVDALLERWERYAPEWAYEALCHMPGLNESQRWKLAACIAQARNDTIYHHVLMQPPDLTEAQHEAIVLGVIQMKDASSLYCTLADIADLSAIERARLFDALAASNNTEWCATALLSLADISEAQQQMLIDVFENAPDYKIQRAFFRLYDILKFKKTLTENQRRVIIERLVKAALRSEADIWKAHRLLSGVREIDDEGKHNLIEKIVKSGVQKCLYRTLVAARSLSDEQRQPLVEALAHRRNPKIIRKTLDEARSLNSKQKATLQNALKQ